MRFLCRKKCRKTAAFAAILQIKVRNDFGWVAEREGFELAIRKQAPRGLKASVATRWRFSIIEKAALWAAF
jgi:hypothetical protein